MKLYRVIPNTFSTGNRLDSRELPGVEDIYYKMGYTSFVGDRGFHKYNNIFGDRVDIEDGKYFFLFSEDAIRQGYYLLTMFHKLKDVDTFYVVEYDVPEDIAFKYFGYGDYKNTNGMSNSLLEIFVEKKNFTTNSQDILTTVDISYGCKREVLLSSLIETLEETENSPFDWLFYNNYFDINYGQSFGSFVGEKENVAKALDDSYLSLTFDSLDGTLIKSPYLTGKIMLINIYDILEKYKSWENAAEYFHDMGIRYDVSEEQSDFKFELIKLSGANPLGSKDSQKILKLLKERNY